MINPIDYREFNDVMYILRLCRRRQSLRLDPFAIIATFVKIWSIQWRPKVSILVSWVVKFCLVEIFPCKKKKKKNTESLLDVNLIRELNHKSSFDINYCSEASGQQFMFARDAINLINLILGRFIY